jgi:hypothetical protein
MSLLPIKRLFHHEIKGRQMRRLQCLMAGPAVAVTVKDRWDLYVAPGYKFNADSVAYVKWGYSQHSIQKLSDGSTGTSIGPGPSHSGTLYGIGFKHKLDTLQPYYYAIEYDIDSTGKGTISAPIKPTNGYTSKVNSSTLSLKLGYLFE